MIPLTGEENESYLKQKRCHVYKKEFIFDVDKSSEDIFKKCRRVNDHCHSTVKYREAANNI